MTHRITFVGLAVSIALAPGWALGFRAQNLHDVNAVSSDTFEVIGQPGSGAADYWCGAGDYARHKLNTAATQRIYISRAVGESQTEPGRTAVQFSLTPPADADTSPGYSLSVKAVGDNLTSAAAIQYCYSRIKFAR